MLAATDKQTSKMRRNLLVAGGQRGRFMFYTSVISTLPMGGFTNVYNT